MKVLIMITKITRAEKQGRQTRRKFKAWTRQTLMMVMEIRQKRG